MLLYLASLAACRSATLAMPRPQVTWPTCWASRLCAAVNHLEEASAVEMLRASERESSPGRLIRTFRELRIYRCSVCICFHLQMESRVLSDNLKVGKPSPKSFSNNVDTKKVSYWEMSTAESQPNNTQHVYCRGAPEWSLSSQKQTAADLTPSQLISNPRETFKIFEELWR